MYVVVNVLVFLFVLFLTEVFFFIYINFERANKIGLCTIDWLYIYDSSETRCIM